MAKKKGLASLVKAPRNTTINGQPHMLAYITGSEADVLKRLGGSGDPGPMGIPSFFYDEVGAVGGTTGTTGSGGQTNFSSDSSSSSRDDDSGSSGTDISYEGEDDYDPYEGTGKTAAEKYGYTSDKADDLSKAGYQTRGLGGLSRSDYADLRDRAAGGESYAQKALEAYEKGLSGELAGAAGSFYTDPLGKVRGHTTLQESFIPGGLRDMFGLSDYMEVYTGRSALDPFNQTRYNDDDGGRDEQRPTTGGGTLQAGEAATPAVTPDSYYQRGVGTATMDLADAAQRDAFLAGLYGTTPSPVGSRFDKEKGLLYLPDGTVIDIRTGNKIKEKRISGLDIFKPLQTYA